MYGPINRLAALILGMQKSLFKLVGARDMLAPKAVVITVGNATMIHGC